MKVPLTICGLLLVALCWVDHYWRLIFKSLRGRLVGDREGVMPPPRPCGCGREVRVVPRYRLRTGDVRVRFRGGGACPTAAAGPVAGQGRGRGQIVPDLMALSALGRGRGLGRPVASRMGGMRLPAQNENWDN